MENIIKSVRELGKAIQADESFKEYIQTFVFSDQSEEQDVLLSCFKT